MKTGLSLRAALGWSLVAWSLLALAQPARAEKRVALVIGNNDYRNVPKLQKAVNDARTMGDALKQLGFSVMVAENQTRQAFSQTLLAFDNAIEPGDTASSMPATASRLRGRISCCRPMCPPRARGRKNWYATRRSWPTALSSGCRTRRRAPPSLCSMPAATIRSNGQAPAPSPAAVASRR